jgi:hypothetical protein
MRSGLRQKSPSIVLDATGKSGDFHYVKSEASASELGTVLAISSRRKALSPGSLTGHQILARLPSSHQCFRHEEEAQIRLSISVDIQFKNPTASKHTFHRSDRQNENAQFFVVHCQGVPASPSPKSIDRAQETRICPRCMPCFGLSSNLRSTITKFSGRQTWKKVSIATTLLSYPPIESGKL